MKSTTFRKCMFPNLFVVLGFWHLPICAADDAPTPFRVEPHVRQLFLDDAGIAEMHNLKRVVHQPTRHPDNPLITADTPWERGCQVYGTAFFDQDLNKFRLWYLTGPRDRGIKPLVMDGYERPPHSTLVAYAESMDGVHWIKPTLGLFPYDGDRRNNLLGVGIWNAEGISVLHDIRDPDPNRRYKALYWEHGSEGWKVVDGDKPFAIDGPRDGIYVAFSPDGIHWTRSKHNPVLGVYSDTNQVVLYDPQIEKYVAFGRFGFGRRVARSESSDFEQWSKPELVLECDEQDGPQTQIYGTGIDLYEGLYLGMIWIYREGGDGKIDTQLAVSRDGKQWTRVGDRATWLTLGPDDSWEGGMVRSTERIIRRGDELYIYYCGVHGPHGGPKFKNVVRKHRVAIGLLKQRRDGFVSLSAGDEPGELLTQPFRLPQGDLHINADATDGEVRVVLCDEQGRPLGEPSRSKPLTGDLLDGAVIWEKPIPDSARRKPVRLRFDLERADLYSYWWR